MAGEIEDQTAGAPPISLIRQGAVAIVELRRRERRNALSRAMQAELASWPPRLARDAGNYATLIRSAVDGVFSVGGDVREILSLAEADVASARAALAAELTLCWLLECYTKPTISLIDGAVMGTGVGISLYGTHRVAGEGYRFSMPETAIGYVPDCGISHAFARMPPGIGLYLGLTGIEVGPADALALGLATHCIPREAFAAIEQHLADADPVDPVLDSRHRQSPRGPLTEHAARIARYFHAPSLAEIMSRLDNPEPEDRAWATETLATLRARAPLALGLTFCAIRNAAALDLRETLIQDYRLAWRLVVDPDFREGATAALIEKGRRPRWRHARAEDVPEAAIGEFFAPLGENELWLPARPGVAPSGHVVT